MLHASFQIGAFFGIDLRWFAIAVLIALLRLAAFPFFAFRVAPFHFTSLGITLLLLRALPVALLSLSFALLHHFLQLLPHLLGSLMLSTFVQLGDFAFHLLRTLLEITLLLLRALPVAIVSFPFCLLLGPLAWLLCLFWSSASFQGS